MFDILFIACLELYCAIRRLHDVDFRSLHQDTPGIVFGRPFRNAPSVLFVSQLDDKCTFNCSSEILAMELKGNKLLIGEHDIPVHSGEMFCQFFYRVLRITVLRCAQKGYLEVYGLQERGRDGAGRKREWFYSDSIAGN